VPEPRAVPDRIDTDLSEPNRPCRFPRLLPQCGNRRSNRLQSRPWRPRPDRKRTRTRTETSDEALFGPSDAPFLYVSADGTGVPARPEERAGRAGKQADGTAKTRQAYLGCVFTQQGLDEEGHPVRDYDFTTYVSTMGTSEEFGPYLRREAIRRGMGAAGEVIILVDGAPARRRRPV